MSVGSYTYTLEADRVVLNYAATEKDEAVRLSQVTEAVKCINLAIANEQTARIDADDKLHGVVTAEIDDAIQKLIGGEDIDIALDTLKELAKALGDGSDVATAITMNLVKEVAAREAAQKRIEDRLEEVRDAYLVADVTLNNALGLAIQNAADAIESTNDEVAAVAAAAKSGDDELKADNIQTRRIAAKATVEAREYTESGLAAAADDLAAERVNRAEADDNVTAKALAALTEQREEVDINLAKVEERVVTKVSEVAIEAAAAVAAAADEAAVKRLVLTQDLNKERAERKAFDEGIQKELSEGLAAEVVRVDKKIELEDGRLETAIQAAVAVASSETKKASSVAADANEATQAALEAEVWQRNHDDEALEVGLISEKQAREAADDALTKDLNETNIALKSKIKAEAAARASNVAALDKNIDTTNNSAQSGIAANSTAITNLEDGKLDNTGGTTRGSYTFSGDMKLDSYVYIGPLWRFNGHSDTTRLALEYNEGGKADEADKWVTAFPFFSTRAALTPVGNANYIFLINNFSVRCDLTKGFSVNKDQYYEIIGDDSKDQLKVDLIDNVRLNARDVEDLTKVFLPQYGEAGHYLLEHIAAGKNCAYFKGEVVVLPKNFNWMLTYCTIAGDVATPFTTVMFGSRTPTNEFELDATQLINGGTLAVATASDSLILYYPVLGADRDYDEVGIMKGDRIGHVAHSIGGAGIGGTGVGGLEVQVPPPPTIAIEEDPPDPPEPLPAQEY